jgi:hypothetical protein
MDSPRFDAWTRRCIALVAGGGAASLLGLRARGTAAAKKENRKRRCRRARQHCRPHNRRKHCCKTLACGAILGLDGRRCCRPAQGLCAEASDCCGDLDCFSIGGLEGETRCCVQIDRDCTGGQSCCGNLTCNAMTGRCEGK